MIKITVNGMSVFAKESNLFLEAIESKSKLTIKDIDGVTNFIERKFGKTSAMTKDVLDCIKGSPFLTQGDLITMVTNCVVEGASSTASTELLKILKTASAPLIGCRITLDHDRFIDLYPGDSIAIDNESMELTAAVGVLRAATANTVVKEYAHNQEDLSKMVCAMVDAQTNRLLDQIKKENTEVELALEFYRLNKDVDNSKIKSLTYVDKQIEGVRGEVYDYKVRTVEEVKEYKHDVLAKLKTHTQKVDDTINEYMECKEENLNLKCDLATEKADHKHTKSSLNYYKSKCDHYDFTMVRVTKILVEMDEHFANVYGILCDKFFDGELTKATYEAFLRNKKKELYTELKKVYKTETNMLTKESADSILDYIEGELRVLVEAKESLAELPSTEELLAKTRKAPMLELLDKVNLFKKAKSEREED